MLYRILVLLPAFVALLFHACGQPRTTAAQTADAAAQPLPTGVLLSLAGDTLQPVEKTPEEWQALLSPSAYKVLRQAGTERAFTGEYWDSKADGVYVCGGCGLPLFDSSTKFDSGTGWPSFWAPLHEDHVVDVEDISYGMKRVENVCARCRGHLGHVFEDGPRPTGLRYCMNSVSLRFIPREEVEGGE